MGVVWHRGIRGIGAALLALSATTALAQFSDAESKGLDDALFLSNLIRKDLHFAKAIPADAKPGTLHLQGLTQPLESADGLMRLHALAGPETAKLLRLILESAHGPLTLASAPTVPVTVPEEVPAALRAPLGDLVSSIAKASLQVRESLAKLSPQERRELIEGLPRWVAGPDLKLDFIRRPMPSSGQLESLLAKVDIGRIQAAATVLATEVEAIAPRLRNAAEATRWVGVLKLQVGGTPVVLAGYGDDTHDDRDAALTLDLGGNDTYRGRHGAGIGYAAVHLDFGGNDFYETPDASLGVGLLGIGLAYDFGGDDDIRAAGMSLGVGIGGVGLWRKAGGHDRYVAGSLSMSFGAWGAGLMADTDGDDRYRIGTWGLGATRMGGAAWLIDLSGEDVFRADGLAMAYAEGEDAHGGGLALLSNRGGADVYHLRGAGLAQGRANGVGSLLDTDGDDVYRAEQGIGLGLEAGSGSLFELGGSDTYTLTGGIGHGVGHGFGFGLLLDRAGDDAYDGEGSRPGGGLLGGLGMLLDAGGEDRYDGVPGSAVEPGETGALGVFVDLGGPDRYPLGFGDSSARLVAKWGIAFDRETRFANPRSLDDVDVPDPQAGSLAKPADDDVVLIARQAADGDAEAMRRMIGIGKLGLDVLIARELPKAGPGMREVIGSVAQACGLEGRNAVAFRLSSKEDGEALNALQICFDFSFKEAGALIVAAMDRPALKRLAARAAGKFEERAAVPSLLRLTLDPDRAAALNALLSLADLNDPASYGTAQAFLDSGDLLMRTAALRLVAKSPDAVAIGQAFAGDPSERRARIGIALLGESGTPAALKAIGEWLLDGRPGVRIEALRALDGRFPADRRNTLFSLQRDPDERVRAVALSVEPGRAP